MNNLIERLRLRFTSGNSVPVERAHITASEFAEIEQLQNQIWQPIETAPKSKDKDGLEVMFCGAWNDDGHWRTSVFWWNGFAGKWEDVYADNRYQPSCWASLPELSQS